MGRNPKETSLEEIWRKRHSGEVLWVTNGHRPCRVLKELDGGFLLQDEYGVTKLIRATAHMSIWRRARPSSQSQSDQ